MFNLQDFTEKMFSNGIKMLQDAGVSDENIKKAFGYAKSKVRKMNITDCDVEDIFEVADEECSKLTPTTEISLTNQEKEVLKGILQNLPDKNKEVLESIKNKLGS